MVNMDYPGPCRTCGSEGECEHRKKEAQEQGLSARDFESDVSSDRKRSDIDASKIDESEKDIDK